MLASFILKCMVFLRKTSQRSQVPYQALRAIRLGELCKRDVETATGVISEMACFLISFSTLSMINA